MNGTELAAALAAAVPFNRHLALEYASVEPGKAEVRLADREEHRNHIGTLHAGALFTVAEAPSGAAFVAAFAAQRDDVVPVVESAEIRLVDGSGREVALMKVRWNVRKKRGS